jgi:hypothetical protein
MPGVGMAVITRVKYVPTTIYTAIDHIRLAVLTAFELFLNADFVCWVRWVHHLD